MCYIQDDCTFKSKSVEGVRDHVKKEHLNLKGLAHDGKGMDDIKSATGTNVSQIYDFLCMLCDKKTQTVDDIQKDDIATHFKTFQAICPHCPHVASSPADLQSHGQTEQYKNFLLSKLLCSKCNYT